MIDERWLKFQVGRECLRLSMVEAAFRENYMLLELLLSVVREMGFKCEHGRVADGTVTLTGHVATGQQTAVGEWLRGTGIAQELS